MRVPSMTPPGSRLPEKVTLREKLAFLSRPSTFGEPEGGVASIETHMSWVFLAGDRVYKLRKPVRYPFLDFSTLAAREADCHAEIRLNRRLAPDVYLGVVRLTREANGTLALDGAGVVADWLVVMRRLPESAMLDRAIVGGTVTPGQIERVAALLAAFYRSLGPADVSEEGYLGRFARQHVNNRALLDSNVRDPNRWRPLASEYLTLAGRASLSLRPPAAPPGSRCRGSAE